MSNHLLLLSSQPAASPPEAVTGSGSAAAPSAQASGAATATAAGSVASTAAPGAASGAATVKATGAGATSAQPGRAAATGATSTTGAGAAAAPTAQAVGAGSTAAPATGGTAAPSAATGTASGTATVSALAAGAAVAPQQQALIASPTLPEESPVGTTYVLTGDLADIIGGDIKSASAYIRTNLPSGTALVDTTASSNGIRIGTAPVDVATDGTFSVTLLGTNNTGLNVAAGTLRYELVVTYVDPGSRGRRTWMSGFFALTANADLKTLLDDADPVAVESASRFALEAKGYRDEAAQIAGADTADELITILDADAGSDFRQQQDARLLATYAPTLTSRDIVLPAADHGTPAGLMFPGKRITVAGEPSFFIKGTNLHGAYDSTTTNWTTGWDWNLMRDGVDLAVEVGANTIRFLGDQDAYAANPATYKARWVQLIDYAKSRGLRVEPVFLNSANGTYTVALASVNTYKAMITDLIGPYIGDKAILGWDICNELKADVAANASVIQQLYTHIKTIDPTCLVTASQTLIATDYGSIVNTLTPIRDYVDFQEIHYYPPNITRGVFPPDLFESFDRACTKPILLGEVGSTRSTTGQPRSGGYIGQAAYLAMIRRYLAGGQIMGAMVWKIKDSATNNSRFGLFDENGNATRQLDEFLAFPSVRLDAARDLVNYRTHPVLVDSGCRDASTTAVGAPEIGTAPTAASGTWGIDSAGGIYPATQHASKADVLWWDVRSQHWDHEAEWQVYNPATASVGVTFDTTDADNTYALVVSVIGGEYTARYLRWNASATPTTLLTETLPGLNSPIDGIWTSHYLRLRVRFYGQVLALYVNDYPVGIAQKASTPNTKVGILRGHSDTTSICRHVQTMVRGRSY